jgi:hypothetical protein
MWWSRKQEKPDKSKLLAGWSLISFQRKILKRPEFPGSALILYRT